MALIKCHECGADVSSDAAACLKCGVKPKKPKKEPQHLNRWQVLWGLGVAVAGVVWMANHPDNSTPTPSREEKDAACRQNLQCWADKSTVDAEYDCKDPIERRAMHSVRWVDDASRPKFTRIAWHNQAAGVVTYIGDGVEFQNGFGAYTRYTYACDYDTASKKVDEVRIFEGRLD